MNISNVHRIAGLLTVIIFGLLLVGPSQAASDLKLDPTIGQDNYEKAVRDLGVGLSYTAVETPEPKGITGFQVGVSATGVDLNDDADYMKQAYGDSDVPSFAVLPRLYLSKGLPLNFDVEGFVAGRPGGNERLYGGAVKWSYWEGSAVSPSIGIRAHGTQLSGVDRLDMTTYGADVSISKGFAMVTPYVGYSLFEIDGTARSTTYPNLTETNYTTTENKVFGGARMSLGLFNLVAQADLGEVDSYSLRANIGF